MLSKYQRLIRPHLGNYRGRLFREYTGLKFQTFWSTGAQDRGEGPALTVCPASVRLLNGRRKGQQICQACGRTQLARALSGAGEGLRFKCGLGVWNYCLAIRVRGISLGLVYLQALEKSPGKQRNANHPGGMKALTKSEFGRASRWLRWMVEEAQNLDVDRVWKAELAQAKQAVVALEKEQVRLHQALQGRSPAPWPVAQVAARETRSEKAVQTLLDCISREYSHPITLRQCAARMGMNAAYLSALFSWVVGRPFKTCLTELRMDKAKALLSDPAKVVSDVAYAVGYEDPNRFRLAFKKATGLAPRIWRETLSLRPPGGAPGESGAPREQLKIGPA